MAAELVAFYQEQGLADKAARAASLVERARDDPRALQYSAYCTARGSTVRGALTRRYNKTFQKETGGNGQ